MTEISPEIVELEPQHAIALRGDVKVADIPAFFERAFVSSAAAAGAAGIEIVGPPFGYYPDMPTETVAIEAGFPVAGPVEPTGDVQALVLPGGRAVVVTHIGPYETMVETYAQLQAWMERENHQPAAGMWESYLSDPHLEPDPAHWRTKIVWPIA